MYIYVLLFSVFTLLQVVDSLWAVLKGNISLVLNVLTATLSLLFGGGTALLNFFLSMVSCKQQNQLCQNPTDVNTT